MLRGALIEGRGIQEWKQHGQGTYTWSDGRKYKGGWKDGKHHGHGEYTKTDGNKYVGDYKDGEYHGQGTQTSSDGLKYEGEFKDGILNGKETYSFPDVRKFVGDWIENVPFNITEYNKKGNIIENGGKECGRVKCGSNNNSLKTNPIISC